MNTFKPSNPFRLINLSLFDLFDPFDQLLQSVSLMSGAPFENEILDPFDPNS